MPKKTPIPKREEVTGISLYNGELYLLYYSPRIIRDIKSQSGFGGLEVACWPLVPKFAAEAVGFFWAKKNPQHAFLWKGSKAVCPMSHISGT